MNYPTVWMYQLNVKSTVWWFSYFANCMWIPCIRAEYRCLKGIAGELCLIALWLCPCIVFYCSLPNSQLSKRLVPGGKTGAGTQWHWGDCGCAAAAGVQKGGNFNIFNHLTRMSSIPSNCLVLTGKESVCLNVCEKVSYFKDKTRAPSAGLDFPITLPHISMHRLPERALCMI